MIDTSNAQNCTRGCWIIAGGLGLLSFLLSLFAAHRGFFTSLILAILVVVFVGLLLRWLFCQGDMGGRVSRSEQPQRTVSPAASSLETEAATASAKGTAQAAETTNETGTTAAVDSGESAADSGAAGSTEVETDASPAAQVEDSAPSDTGSDLADEIEAGATDTATETSDADDASNDDAPVTFAEPSAVATAETPDDPEPVAEETSAEEQADVAATPEADTADADATETEPTDDDKPAGLTAARDSGADNLKEIKGVGPKLEQLLNSMGFYHFDQIAGWTEREIAWVDQNLKGFKGRVTRDEWVKQAKILASGGETEFSKRVEKGSVY